MPLNYENKYYSKEIKVIVGCDEAGRGPLLGPVVAAAVILPRGFFDESINDSKKLTKKKRELAYEIIVKNAIDYGLGIVDADEIDRINIYEAARLAMIKAIRSLKHPFDMILTDAMPLASLHMPYDAIIKGDGKVECIAAASIIAKVTRDRMMEELDSKYPNYGIKKHKGYGTKAHIEALNKYGPIPHVHRKTFHPVSDFFIEKTKLF